jgi:glycosyltransferase involved in cell wall biosynthesis
VSDQPIITVIMANYNGSAYLHDAISSVQKQTLRDIEIIISDDASSDGSVDIVKRLMADDPRIRLLTSDRNNGPAFARNRGLELARGKWIAIVDSDDLIYPTRLATLVDSAERDHADIVADGLLQFRVDGELSPRPLLFGRWAKHPFWVDIVDFVMLNRFYNTGPALGYLKPLFKASILKGLDVRYNETLKIAEDYDLIFRLLRSGSRMRVYPPPFYFYRKHAGSVSHRLSESALNALKAVDLQYLEEVSTMDHRLAAAILAGIDSIDTAVAFEKLLGAVKGRHWSAALGIALARPQAVVLLRLPIGVRLRRLVPLRIRAFQKSTLPFN